MFQALTTRASGASVWSCSAPDEPGNWICSFELPARKGFVTSIRIRPSRSPRTISVSHAAAQGTASRMVLDSSTASR